MHLLLLHVVVLIGAFSSKALGVQTRNCVTPPITWCDSAETAQLCGVTDQCAAYNTTQKDQKIKLTMLYESLCPDCQRFLTKTLYPTIWKQMGEIISEIELVPYGNAREQQVGQATAKIFPEFLKVIFIIPKNYK